MMQAVQGTRGGCSRGNGAGWWASAAWGVAAGVALAACGEQAPEPDEAPQAAEVPAAPVDSVPRPWRTVVSQDQDSKSAVPEPFRVEGTAVRVISELGPTITPLSNGVLVVNVLPAVAGGPVASLRSERTTADTVYADTSIVDLEPGPFQLYVAHQTGLREWRVTVQEQP